GTRSAPAPRTAYCVRRRPARAARRPRISGCQLRDPRTSSSDAGGFADPSDFADAPAGFDGFLGFLATGEATSCASGAAAAGCAAGAPEGCAAAGAGWVVAVAGGAGGVTAGGEAAGDSAAGAAGAAAAGGDNGAAGGCAAGTGPLAFLPAPPPPFEATTA